MMSSVLCIIIKIELELTHQKEREINNENYQLVTEMYIHFLGMSVLLRHTPLCFIY